MKFKQNLKLYLFKDRNWCDLSIRVSDSYVVTYHFSEEVLQNILARWRDPHGGFDEKTEPGTKITVQHKTLTPRPERAETSYIRWSVWKNGVTHNHRLEYSDMEYLEREYFYQRNNTMHWD